MTRKTNKTEVKLIYLLNLVGLYSTVTIIRQLNNQSPPNTDSQFSRLILYSVGIIIMFYQTSAVGTVFEIATFPLDKILDSRSIKKSFFLFLKIWIKKKRKQ